MDTASGSGGPSSVESSRTGLATVAPPVPAPPTSGDPFDAVHAVADTIAGPNLRPLDNLVQLAVIVLFALAGSIADSRFGPWTFWGFAPFGVPAVDGALIGTVVGLFVSGVALGIYRLSRRWDTD